MTLLQFLLGFAAYGAAMLGSCFLFMATAGGWGGALWVFCAAIVHYYWIGAWS